MSRFLPGPFGLREGEDARRVRANQILGYCRRCWTGVRAPATFGLRQGEFEKWLNVWRDYIVACYEESGGNGLRIPKRLELRQPLTIEWLNDVRKLAQSTTCDDGASWSDNAWAAEKRASGKCCFYHFRATLDSLTGDWNVELMGSGECGTCMEGANMSRWGCPPSSDLDATHTKDNTMSITLQGEPCMKDGDCTNIPYPNPPKDMDDFYKCRCSEGRTWSLTIDGASTVRQSANYPPSGTACDVNEPQSFTVPCDGTYSLSYVGGAFSGCMWACQDREYAWGPTLSSFTRYWGVIGSMRSWCWCMTGDGQAPGLGVYAVFVVMRDGAPVAKLTWGYGDDVKTSVSAWEAYVADAEANAGGVVHAGSVALKAGDIIYYWCCENNCGYHYLGSDSLIPHEYHDYVYSSEAERLYGYDNRYIHVDFKVEGSASFELKLVDNTEEE